MGRSKILNDPNYSPLDFNWKRCAFRTFSVFGLLFVAETVPSFGAILDLVGSSTVTLLTFIFPPYFYMKLADASIGHKEWDERQVTTGMTQIKSRVFQVMA